MNPELYESLSKQAARMLPRDQLNPYNYDMYIKNLTGLVVEECIRYLNTEINRLADYQNSLPEYSNHSKREDVDLAIEKCLDNIQGIKKHFGVSE